MDILFIIECLIIIAGSLAVTTYFVLNRIVSLKSISLLFLLGVAFFVSQLVSNIYFLESISLKDTLFLKLGAQDRLMLTSYTMFASVMACAFVQLISIIFGIDLDSECKRDDDVDDEEK